MCLKCGRQHVWADRGGGRGKGQSTPEKPTWGCLPRKAARATVQTQHAGDPRVRNPGRRGARQLCVGNDHSPTPCKTGLVPEQLRPQETEHRPCVPREPSLGGGPSGGALEARRGPRGFRSLLVHRKLSFPTAVCRRIPPCGPPAVVPTLSVPAGPRGGNVPRTQRNDPQGTGLRQHPAWTPVSQEMRAWPLPAEAGPCTGTLHRRPR